LYHAFLKPKEHVDEEFMLILGDNIFKTNLEGAVRHQEEDRVNTAFSTGEVPYNETSRYGACDTNDDGKMIKKPDDPLSNFVMTGFYTLSLTTLYACKLVQLSDRDKYEFSDAINLLIRSVKIIDTILMEVWRITVGYSEEQDEAKGRLQGN
jgi:glucose-1-phosphate thymidylyltransferase